MPADKLEDVPAIVRDRYRDLLMMREVSLGAKFKDVAATYGLSPRTVSMRVKTMASEMMREAMTQTQGDPNHPAEVRWTVEEFTRDPRGCMNAMMKHHIELLEHEWQALNQ